MKQIYSRGIALLLPVLLLAGFRPALAQSLQFQYIPSVTTAGTLNILVRAVNGTQQNVALGNAELVLQVNGQALNFNAVTITTRGKFDASVSPGGYQAMQVFPDGSTPALPIVYLQILQRRDALLADARQIAAGATDTIAVISMPILAGQCEANAGLQPRNPQLGFVTNFNGVNIGLPPNTTFSAQAGQLRPAFTGTMPVLTIDAPTPPSGVVGYRSTRNAYCGTGNVTLRFPAGTPSFAAVSVGIRSTPAGPITEILSRTSGNTTTPIIINLANGANGQPIQSGTFFAVRINNGACFYNLANAGPITIDQPLEELGLPFVPAICTSDLTGAPINYSLSLPGNADSAVWTITPANAFTSITPTAFASGSSVDVVWNPAFSGFATLSARGVNACGLGASSAVRVRLNAAVPAAPATPVSDAGAVLPLYCTNDFDNNAIWRVPTASVNAAVLQTVVSYEWEVLPLDAAQSINDVFIPGPDFPIEDTLAAEIIWSRFFSGPATIKVRGVNACGEGAWSSEVTVNFRPLPAKPTVPVPDTDTICQGTDSTIFTTTIADTSLLKRDAAYVWQVRRVTGPLNANYPGTVPIQPTDPSGSTIFITDTNAVSIKWNPAFYGWVEVVVAGNSRECFAGLAASDLRNPVYDYFNLTGADINGTGDTARAFFFVRPNPLRPASRPTFGDRAYCLSTPGSLVGVTDTFSIPGVDEIAWSRYATHYRWEVSRRDPLDPTVLIEDSTLGTFERNDTTFLPGITEPSARFNFASTAVPGTYFVRVRGVNSCGQSIYSMPRRIIVTTDEPSKPNPIEITPLRMEVAGDPNPRRARSLCLNPSNSTVRTGYTNSPFGANLGEAAFFRWRIVPATAGVIVQAPGANLTGGIDSNVVAIDWDDTFIGTATIVVTPFNGCNLGDESAQNAISDSIEVDIFDAPSVFTGLDGGSQNVPTGTRILLGGGTVGAATVPPTISGGNGPYTLSWLSNPTPPVGSPSAFISNGVRGGASLNTDLNPFFAPTTPGNYTVTLEVQDANLCGADALSVTSRSFNFVQGATFNPANVWLQGAYNATTQSMSTGLSTAGLFANRQYVDENVPAANNHMVPGYTVPANVVDIIEIQVRQTAATPNTQIRGRGWLLADGSVRDFETGLDPVIRFNPELGTSQGHMIVGHRNHLRVMSALPVAFQPDDVQVIAPGSPGYVDYSNSSNIFGYRYSGAGAVIVNGRAMLPAGFVLGTTRAPFQEVNSLQYKEIQNLVNTASPNVGYFRGDVTLDGLVNTDDLEIIDSNNNIITYSTIQ